MKTSPLITALVIMTILLSQPLILRYGSWKMRSDRISSTQPQVSHVRMFLSFESAAFFYISITCLSMPVASSLVAEDDWLTSSPDFLGPISMSGEMSFMFWSTSSFLLPFSEGVRSLWGIGPFLIITSEETDLYPWCRDPAWILRLELTILFCYNI